MFVNRHKTKWRRITATAADVLIGTSEFTVAAAGVIVATQSFVRGPFTVSGGPLTFELQHRCEITQATNGFGIQSNFGVIEVYADVLIWQTA